MDRSIVRQSLPSDEYLYLLGVSLSVFASNYGFMIENISRVDPSYNWYELIDAMSGQIESIVEKNFGIELKNQ